MAELKVITPDLLSNISETEINSLIEQIVEKSKKNIEKICELTLECTSFLSSADSSSTVLSNQGLLKKLIGSVTGKNQSLQNTILNDNVNALYVAQGIINRVMFECTNNRKLLLAVNDRVSDLFLELKENQNDIAATVLMTRQAIVAFYQKYQEEILTQNKRISRMEEYVKVRCPKCQQQMLSWQRVCSYCGYIHSMKIDGFSEKTRQVLYQISEVVKDEKISEDIIWDITAQKKERVLQKVKRLIKIGKLPGYTEELQKDVENLINKCSNAEFQIAVVGVMKAGKSFLMNALIGAEIASVEVNPETAALTKFRSANGYYVIVKFHTGKQWEKLKESVRTSKKTGKGSLLAHLTDSAIGEKESEWIDHKDLLINCKDLKDLQETVKQYTSSQTIDHLFVSEVEVGVDKSIFNMPKEVVFVDTPGLKDPVKYRSDITREYIKKSDAVLIALKPGPFTTEGLEVVTTVLDCTETDKAYIIGTQKDLNKDVECEKYVSNWVDHLVGAKRYRNKRQAMSRIILTSAKMDLLLNKWFFLSEKEKEDEECFSMDDYSDLQNYCAKIMKKRNFELLQMSQGDYDIILNSTGISALRKKLKSSLIDNAKNLKLEDIEQTFIRCKKQIIELSENSILHNETIIELAMDGEAEFKKKANNLNKEREKLKSENEELKREAEKLENAIKKEIEKIERKVK